MFAKTPLYDMDYLNALRLNQCALVYLHFYWVLIFS